MIYNLELDKVIDEINECNAKRIYLQFPEGLKQDSLEIAKKIEDQTRSDTIIQIDACYGACDINEALIRQTGADLIIHFGHTEFKR